MSWTESDSEWSLKVPSKISAQDGHSTFSEKLRFSGLQSESNDLGT
jgi:hypothetical protein